MNRRRLPARFLGLVAAIAIAASALLVFTETAPASAASTDSFQAGNIISDQNFFDANAMSAAQIQSFLDSKIPTCSTGNCLNILHVDTTSRPAAYTQAGNLVCNPYQGALGESAATVIFKVEQACSVSAKAILVILQKEEGLVTKTSVSAAVLARAMGYGCPDSAAGACDSLYYGFYNQVYLAAWQLRRYGTPAVVGNYQPGVNFVAYSPNAACGGTNITIQNRATAALYTYTPYQPNAAALNNLNGTGDACSSYGNRNFWVYYNSWFGDPTVTAGTPEANVTITPAPSSIGISGWAVDPDDPTGTVPVSIQIDQSWYALSAAAAGADLSAQYAGAGTSHYFSGSYPESPGNHTLCIYLLNAGGLGGVGSLGCQTVAVPSAPAPLGAITSATAANGVVSITGWAVRPDAPTAPVSLATQLGSSWTGYSTGLASTAAVTAVASAGPNQGFAGSFAAPPGTQTFCLWGVPTTGPAVQITCASVTVPPPTVDVTAIDAVTGGAGQVTVSGWAVDPDSPSASVSMAIQVGSNWYPLTANSPSTEPLATVPTAGPNQGFVGSVALPAGTYTVCIWVTEPSGTAANIGCRTATVLPPPPTQSHIDSIAGGQGAVSVVGWAVWPDKLSSSVNLAVQIGASWYGLSANTPSTEAAAAITGAGANHGFAVAIPLPQGSYTVCIWAGTTSGGATNIGCQKVVVAAPPATQSHIDSIAGGIGQVSVAGWAIWPDKPAASVNMAIQVGASWTAMTANSPSTEGATAVPGAGTGHGFVGTVALAPGSYSVCIWAGASAGWATNIGCGTVTVASPPPVQGAIQSITGGTGSVTVVGWAVWPDKLTSSVNMAIQDGASWYAMTANAPSAAAAAAVSGAGPNHGFSQTQPLAAGVHSICIWAGLSAGGATNLGCQTVTVN